MKLATNAHTHDDFKATTFDKALESVYIYMSIEWQIQYFEEENQEQKWTLFEWNVNKWIYFVKINRIRLNRRGAGTKAM